VTKRNNGNRQFIITTEETGGIEYKRNISSLETDDLVAFANSILGGSIFIGVDELREGSKRFGKIVGCLVNDAEKRKIIDKANNCFPHVSLKVIEHKREDLEYYEVIIPSGKCKPYCTLKGTYCIRTATGKAAWLPDDLLALFVEKETRQFVSKFREASQGLQSELNKLNAQVKDEMQNIRRNIGYFADETLESLNTIRDTGESAESSASDAQSNSDEILRHVERISELEDNSEAALFFSKIAAQRVNSLLEHFKLEDPYKVECNKKMERLVEGFLERKERLDPYRIMKMLEKANCYVDLPYIETCIKEQKNKRRKKRSISRKTK